MTRTFWRQALLPVVALLFFAGCAKQPVLTHDAPLGGPLPSTPMTQTAPAHTQSEGAQQKSLAATPNGAAASGTADKASATISDDAGKAAATLQAALEKIYFDFDSADLSPAAREKLVADYQLLQKNAALKIRIEGNCDERGADEYNLALGERRARAAARYLTTLGIPPERLSTVSFGEEKPAAAGHDETAWAQNRRDEFVVTGR
ncbi:MAG TPA: peptidoglycan-associated lipoprotein Pal [Geobacteraceae bacterium]|nr:peptidoglycan-associated lipoprotein Pal [Geobacteraceae bacterium]